MKKIRLRTVVIYGLAGLSGALLLHTSQSVQKAEEKLTALQQGVTQEEESIRVLRTEWAYLNSPQRIETLARQYLNLKAPDPVQMKTQGQQPLPDKVSPAVAVQPVSFTSPVSPHDSSPPKPSPAQKIPQEKDFSSLIDQVTKGGDE